jgi:hypothetical protein
LALLRSNPPLRRLLAAWLQSCVGTGAGYVALLLLTYRHLHTSWAITGVLLAEFVPAIVLGSWFGSLADAHSKRLLLVTGSLLQAVAFGALAFASTAPAIVGLALVAGVGNALQRPAMRLALRSLAGDASQKAAAIFDTFRWVGITVGPLIAAALLLVDGPGLPLALNGASFAIAAGAIATIPLPSAAAAGEHQPGPSEGIRAGLRVAFASPGIGCLMACAAGQVVAGGLLNVCEPLYANRVLRGTGSDYAALVACYGFGMVAATALVVRRGDAPVPVLANRYVAALALTAVGMCGSAIVGSVPLAAWTFAATGYGNGLLVITETQILFLRVAANVQGRLFGAKDTVEGAFFLVGLASAGGLIAAFGVRAVLGEGAAIFAICAGASIFGLRVLRRSGTDAIAHPAGGTPLPDLADTAVLLDHTLDGTLTQPAPPATPPQ